MMMACIEKIYSVSALVGSKACNGNCSFCAAKDLKKDAPENNKMPCTFKSALKLSARYGGWSLSLTSSGEPTCSPEAVTNALKDYQEVAQEGAYFPNVNLFTNGILFGNDEFCKKYLPAWKKLGLTAVAVSIHELTEKGQAKIYGLKEYPRFTKIFNNIRKYDLQGRATVLLRKGGIDNPSTYQASIEMLRNAGVENITSWPIGNPDNSRNEYTPSRWNLLKIRLWLRKNAKKQRIPYFWLKILLQNSGKTPSFSGDLLNYSRKRSFLRNPAKFFCQLISLTRKSLFLNEIYWFIHIKWNSANRIET